MKQYMALMGLKAKDKVTGYTGVVTCVSFDLYGCIQVALLPAATNDGKDADGGKWFDHKRIEVLDKTPVMALPNFDTTPGVERGPAAKPPRSL